MLAWDCKVTPAYSACQEGNTIGCIPSNDGLDAGLGPGFPQKQSFKVFSSQFSAEQMSRVASAEISFLNVKTCSRNIVLETSNLETLKPWILQP